MKAFGLAFLLPARFDIMDADDVHRAVVRDEMLLVDVRNPDEWKAQGVPQYAETISLTDQEFASKVAELSQQYPEKRIAISCLSGKRAERAIEILAEGGLTGLVSVKDGLNGWRDAGLSVEAYKA